MTSKRVTAAPARRAEVFGLGITLTIYIVVGMSFVLLSTWLASLVGGPGLRMIISALATVSFVGVSTYNDLFGKCADYFIVKLGGKGR